MEMCLSFGFVRVSRQLSFHCLLWCIVDTMGFITKENCLKWKCDVLLCSSESAAEKVTAAAVGVSALSSAKTTLAADPLATLAKQLGGSKRNALLRWCQNRTATYTVTTNSLFCFAAAVLNLKISNCMWLFYVLLFLNIRKNSGESKPLPRLIVSCTYWCC